MFLSSFFPKKLPTLGGEGENTKWSRCVGFDRAERAPFPRSEDEIHGWAKRADQRCGGALKSSRAAKRRASRVAMRPSLGRGVTTLGRQEGFRFMFARPKKKWRKRKLWPMERVITVS